MVRLLPRGGRSRRIATPGRVREDPLRPWSGDAQCRVPGALTMSPIAGKGGRLVRPTHGRSAGFVAEGAAGPGGDAGRPPASATVVLTYISQNGRPAGLNAPQISARSIPKALIRSPPSSSTQVMTRCRSATVDVMFDSSCTLDSSSAVWGRTHIRQRTVQLATQVTGQSA